MRPGKIGLSMLTAALAATAAACASTADGPRLTLPSRAQSALVIVAADLRGQRDEIGSLITGSARPNEHLEMIDVGFRSTNIVDPPASRPAPSIPGPMPPKKLTSNPTSYQRAAHARQEKAYRAKVASDMGKLHVLLAGQMRTWAADACAALERLVPVEPTSWDVGAGLRDAAGYFLSLQQAGADVGSRRVVVVFWPPDRSGAVVPLQPQSLTGITVVLANFPGGEREQAVWQADLLQAGADRAVVLVPGAIDELRRVVSQALSGHAVPGPTVVRFGLNSARLGAPERAALAALAGELRASYPDAPATVLGFADPIGSYSRNLRLSFVRALAVRDFLVAHGVAASRLFALGYGAGLPFAPAAPDGAQPLDRRVVVVIEPTR